MPSNYFLRLHHAIRQGVWRLGSEKDSRIKDQVDILIGEWKVLCGHSKLIHSLPSWVLNDLNAPARANSHIRHRKQNLSVFGAFSRVISVPSVSGPSFQVCGHHIDCLLSRPSQLSGINARRKASAYPFIGLGFKGLRSSSTACSSARDLSFSNSMREEWHSSSTDSSGLCRNIPINRSLKLNSGSCYLPHPDKEETGGEDAHFICTGEKAIGIADGVGGWADRGVDAGKYARELMSNSLNLLQEEPKGSINPARVLEKAYNITKSKGSSTACIIALTDEGLHAINLGDSGFIVVRDGCTVFRSPAQQHEFNYTYQLESGSAGNSPSSGQVFTVFVAPGDVIIAGTDGLFDNLYNNDIIAIVVHAVRAGFGPQVTAQKIAALARQRAQDKNRQTPFSTAAQEAGFRYYGGKLDDITVVVSYITSDHNQSLPAKEL